MHQSTAAQQQVHQVVTASHSQIPVAHYVSVVASKQDAAKTADAIKTIVQTQASQQVDGLTATIRSEPAVITLYLQKVTESPSNTKSAADTKTQIRTVTNQQQQQRQSQVHVVSPNQPQMYSTNQLQYVDSSGDHGVYVNGSSSSNFQYNDTNQLFTSTQQPNNNSSGLYFDSTSGSHVGSQPTVVSSQHQMNSLQSMQGSGGQNLNQFIASPGGSTYLIQGSGSEAGNLVAMPIGHTTRASPATVHWLMDHFENSEGVSLPRALMYNHYLLHCQEQQLDPVNAASFGKLVRSVFIGLRTRRLGTRGNSKYHYYGIRIKGNSPLNSLQEEISYIAMRQQPSSHTKRFKALPPAQGDHKPNIDNHATQSATEQVQQQAQQHQQFLGDATQALPDLDPIQAMEGDPPMPSGITSDDLLILEDLYRDHCANVLDIIVSLQFAMVENLWQSFWRADSENMMKSELEAKLPRHKLMIMCNWIPVQRWIKDSDHMMYQSLVEVLIPDVLRPIPSALTQAIRNFAKGLEAGLNNALKKADIPPDLTKLKIAAVSAFSQTLRRYTSLNHLAQAARAVLNNVAQINQMLADLNRVDFTNVQEQASWVCQCPDSVVHELETDFKTALSEQRTLEQWADWLETVVGKMLLPHEGTPGFTKAARQFLLKWCFYSSMVIRDLTLRSAASFGSFHLIRLLYDEYMFYLVEHRVAQATGETAIAVMGEFANISVGQFGMPDSPSSSMGTDSSATPSPAFIASAPISIITSSIKQIEKGVKRPAEAMNETDNPLGSVSIGGIKATAVTDMMTVKTQDGSS
uniref:Regulatory factor X n=1 Tax=Ciona intestinalis TaxID=7719 RepID=Q4H2V6_CIOIN|nr:regulatory factor X [Ciona intestinalis]BAE06671.1 regulatory factor X [Ciona intestinalis]|eukprot:NP_001071807.1 regulatory factor X [Ciona intestinalis]